MVLAARNEARLFALAIVRDPEYRNNLMSAMRDRTVPAAVENTILAYAYGKPTERVEVGKPGEFEELDDLSDAALLAHGQLLLGVLAGEPKALEQYAGLQAQRKREAEADTSEAAKRSLVKTKTREALEEGEP
jgi:hypothetical protein